MINYFVNSIYSWGRGSTKEEALENMRGNLRASKDNFPLQISIARVEGDAQPMRNGDVKVVDGIEGEVLDFGVNPEVGWNEIEEIESIMKGVKWLKKNGRTIHGVKAGTFSTPKLESED